ncbi:MAG: hypothetical protein A2452_12240 [Candidatus Firestonebacteria bacterium RIFOXYC2_FULL_39_67]|nr:MAG: hypothetical protein A2536_07770 [Candidatus Firestonebacteria bacterium RIFOXYD2_FULL_39_29]OGF55618.1 MAG: hypothetical protein A2452_12240 [Candidatus Firestonebacteria bacterium RIFOXYC2_FULL_39_67]
MGKNRDNYELKLWPFIVFAIIVFIVIVLISRIYDIIMGTLGFALIVLAICWYEWMKADQIKHSTDINNPYRKVCKNCNKWKRIGAGIKTGKCERIKERLLTVSESPEDFGCIDFYPYTRTPSASEKSYFD